MRAVLRRLVLILLALALLSHPARVALKAAALLPEVLDAPVRPLDTLAPRPRFEVVPLQLGDLSWDLHLYLPGAAGRHGGLILEVAISPDVVRHPRAVELARDLARAGVAVALVDSPFLTHYELTTREVLVLVASFQYLQGRPEIDPRRVALGGFSVGGSMALLGAADPRIAGQVAAVLSFGGYYDVTQAVEAVIREEVAGLPWQPDPTSVYTFRQHLLEAIDASPALRLHVLEDGPRPRDLSLPERRLVEFLERPPPEPLPALRRLLPPAALEETLALSPRRHLESIQAPLVVMHDRGDGYIPVTESRALVREAAELGKTVLYAESSLFEHVQPLRQVGPLTRLRETLKLGEVIFRFLSLVA